MWPSSFGGFLRGGALCCPLARSRRSWTAVPRLGPALRRRHFGSNPRRFSRRRLTLACAAAAHGSMVLPACCSTCIWLCAITGLGDWEGQRWWQGQQQRVQGESGSRPHLPAAWTSCPLRPGPCNPQPLLWAGRFRLSPRAKGRGSTREATTRNIPKDQQQPRFCLQDLLV